MDLNPIQVVLLDGQEFPATRVVSDFTITDPRLDPDSQRRIGLPSVTWSAASTRPTPGTWNTSRITRNLWCSAWCGTPLTIDCG